MDTSQTTTEQQLLTQIINGEEQAFIALYRQYWETLFVTAAKVLRSKEEAADVVQDVFLSLWGRKETLQITGSVAAYLQTSVRYKAIHYIEKNITRRDYLTVLLEVGASISSANPETQIQFKQLQQLVQETIANMPPKMREVYQLSRKEELTHSEIAEKLGISPETVKKHIQHAKQVLKTAVGGALVAYLTLILTTTA